MNDYVAFISGVVLVVCGVAIADVLCSALAFACSLTVLLLLTMHHSLKTLGPVISYALCIVFAVSVVAFAIEVAGKNNQFTQPAAIVGATLIASGIRLWWGIIRRAEEKS